MNSNLHRAAQSLLEAIDLDLMNQSFSIEQPGDDCDLLVCKGGWDISQSSCYHDLTSVLIATK